MNCCCTNSSSLLLNLQEKYITEFLHTTIIFALSQKYSEMQMPQNDSLQSLPAEIKLKVLQLLSLRDLQTVTRVSRNLRDATQDPRLWRSLALTLTQRTWPDFREIIGLQKLKLITSVTFEQNISAKKAEETLRRDGLYLRK